MSILDDARETVDELMMGLYNQTDHDHDDDGCAFCGCILGDDEIASGQCQECRISNRGQYG